MNNLCISSIFCQNNNLLKSIFFWNFLVCSPDVYLPFTHNLKDESSSRTHVRADNVSLATSGSACFIGRSALAMPKFANMELGSYLYVKLTYRHMSSSPKNEVLVYNGDCERKPSLILGSTADGNFVSVVTTSGEQHTLHVKSSVRQGRLCDPTND